MIYLAPDRMVDLFGEQEMLHLSQLYDPDAVDINTDRVQAAIDWATSIANTYISVPYSLPLASVPLVLEAYVADLARYQMDMIDPRADVRLRYEDAIAWFRLLAAGKVDLGLTAEGGELQPDAPLIGGDIDYLTPDQVFTEETLIGY